MAASGRQLPNLFQCRFDGENGVRSGSRAPHFDYVLESAIERARRKSLVAAPRPLCAATTDRLDAGHEPHRFVGHCPDDRLMGLGVY
jgi:hypothetical protein